jgi:hypothetical protein
MRATLAKVMLHEPSDIETDLISQADLLQHFPISPLLPLPLRVRVGLVTPGPRSIDLVQQIQLHL